VGALAKKALGYFTNFFNKERARNAARWTSNQQGEACWGSGRKNSPNASKLDHSDCEKRNARGKKARKKKRRARSPCSKGASLIRDASCVGEAQDINAH